MTSTHKPAGGAHPPAPPAPDPAHAFAPNGDGAGSGQPLAPVRGARNTRGGEDARRPAPGPSLSAQPAVKGPDGSGTREEAPGRLRIAAGASPALDAPRAARSHAAARGGKPHPIAAAMSEDRGPDSLDAHVRRLIKDLGLRGYHTRDSRGSHQGYPDWTIAGTRVIFRELKRENGKVTGAQAEWLATLAEAGADADVWRPSHLLSGKIVRELAAISGIGRTPPGDAA